MSRTAVMNKREAKEQMRVAFDTLKDLNAAAAKLRKIKDKSPAGKVPVLMSGSTKVLLDSAFFAEVARTIKEQEKIVNKSMDALAKAKRGKGLTVSLTKRTDNPVVLSDGLVQFFRDPVFANLGLGQKFFEGYSSTNLVYSLIHYYIRVKGLRRGMEIMYDDHLLRLLNSAAIVNKVGTQVTLNRDNTLTVSASIVRNSPPGDSGLGSDRMHSKAVMKLRTYLTIGVKNVEALGLVNELNNLRSQEFLNDNARDIANWNARKVSLEGPAAKSALGSTLGSRLSPTIGLPGLSPSAFTNRSSPGLYVGK